MRKLLLSIILMALPCFAHNIECEDIIWPLEDERTSNPSYSEKQFHGTLSSKCTLPMNYSPEMAKELFYDVFLKDTKGRKIISGPEDRYYDDNFQQIPALFYQVRETSKSSHGRLDVLFHSWIIPGENDRYISLSQDIKGQGRAKYTKGLEIYVTLQEEQGRWKIVLNKTLHVRKPSIAPRSLFMERVTETFAENFIQDQDLILEKIESFLKK